MEQSRRKFLKTTAVLALTSPIVSLLGSMGKANNTVRFGLMSDSHYAKREASNTRFYSESLRKLREAVTVFNREQVDFAMHLGDFKDQDENKQPETTLSFLQELEAEYAKFGGARFHCVGNHDIDSISKQQFLSNVTNTGIPQERSFYSFDRNGFHFVVLDATYSADGQNYNNGNFRWDDAHIPEHEWVWLQEDLRQTNLPTVVFSHYTLFEFRRNGKHYHVAEFEKVQRILADSGKVIAVLQGHVHEERRVRINGIYYCTFCGMVDYSGLENNAFSIVEISEERLRITGYKRASDFDCEIL